MRRLILLALFVSASAFSQVTPQPLIFVAADPAGACSNGGPLRWNPLLGHEWGCVAGTWTNITGSGGGGSGTVTSFSAGTLSPVFTTSVATATTTPALTFALTNAGAGTVFGNRTGSAAAPAYTAVPVLGLPGTTIGTLGLAGNTSGTATITPQAAAGTPTLTLPSASGTFADGATSPLALSATTGNLTCTTCATTTNGGALSGTAPVAISAAGAVSVTGADGAVLAGSSPAFTVTPTLGIAGTSTGTLSLTGVTSGTVLITPQSAAGSPTLTLPNATGTFAVSATSPLSLSATTGALTCSTCNTSSATVTTVSAPSSIFSVSNPTTTPALTFATGQTTNRVIGSDSGGTLALMALTSAQLPATAVQTNQSNAWTTGTQDFSGAAALNNPSSAGFAPTTGGSVGYDSTKQATVAGGNGSLTGSFPRLIYWAHPASDIICAHGGDTSLSFSYGATVCNNAAGTDSINASRQSFSSQFTIPANFMTQDKMLRVSYEFGLWSPSTAAIPTPDLKLGSTTVFDPNGGVATSVSMTNNGFIEQCYITANSAVGGSATVTTDCAPMIPGWTSGSWRNIIVPQTVATNGSLVLSFPLWFSTRGVVSGTYTSGGSITGTTSQTCALTAFNGTGGSGATATVSLTGTNTISGGHALVITNTGSGYTGTSTTATLGNGTATCSGTATIVTVLGGEQGNAWQLRSVMAEELN